MTAESHFVAWEFVNDVRVLSFVATLHSVLVGRLVVECPHTKSCNMYPLFSIQGLLEIWKVRFCQKGYERCERYKRSQAGEEVPPNLLPNGDVLELPAKRTR